LGFRKGKKGSVILEIWRSRNELILGQAVIC